MDIFPFHFYYQKYTSNSIKEIKDFWIVLWKPWNGKELEDCTKELVRSLCVLLFFQCLNKLFSYVPSFARVKRSMLYLDLPVFKELESIPTAKYRGNISLTTLKETTVSYSWLNYWTPTSQSFSFANHLNDCRRNWTPLILITNCKQLSNLDNYKAGWLVTVLLQVPNFNQLSHYTFRLQPSRTEVISVSSSLSTNGF